ncbi:MAG: hypothetical protein AB8B60_02915 [Sulfitobacter sp.]
MNKKALQKQFEYPLTWKDLAVLPAEQLALLSLANFAAAELNILQRIYIQTAHNLTQDAALDVAIAAQRYVVLRTWSAKLFEFAAMFEGLLKQGLEDDTTLEMAKEAVERFGALKESDGYAIVRNVRHEASNHYSFSAALKNLSHVPDHANCNMYMNKLDGNSYYPMGEEVMFVGRLNRHGASIKTEEEKQQLLVIWHDWNVEANEWLRKVHERIFSKFVSVRFPDRSAREKLYWFDPKLAGDMVPPSIPIFLRNNFVRKAEEK